MTKSAAPFAPLESVCVYCGSKPGTRPEYVAAARELGALIGKSGLSLVYGGGNTGMMGALADAALAAGARVVGVIPRRLVDREQAHRGLHELFAVDTMHERKALLTKHADAIVAMPGGIGTLDELFEAITWNELGFHNKPSGLLDVAGYFTPLVETLERFDREGFLYSRPREMLAIERDPKALLEELARRAPKREFFEPGAV